MWFVGYFVEGTRLPDCILACWVINENYEFKVDGDRGIIGFF